MLDCLIIGAGPGGMKASILLKEKGYDIALLEKGAPGGKVNIAPLIVNYPGIDSISGPDLAIAMYSDIFYKKINFINEEVTSIKKEDNHFIVQSNKQIFETKTILIATGTKEKKLGLEHDDDWLGKGVSYCALCDGHFYRNKDVAVIVGDMHALKEALYLSNLCKTVYVISKEDTIVGDVRSYNALLNKENVKFIYNQEMKEYIGKDKLEGIKLFNNKTNKETILNLDGLFPLIGDIPNTEFIDFDILNELGQVIVNNDKETSFKGIYAIGDVINRKVHQIYLSEVDANIAVNSIIKYLSNN